jgi:hypothetical protein
MMGHTIDEIIIELESIVENCIHSNSCIGYFAVLYLKVTCRIKEEIANKSFQNCIRMEKLDILFASRFIEACNSVKNSKPLSSSWQIAFESASSPQAIIMQHLLLGMNAHINLALGIAAAETMKDEEIEGVREDFERINTILYAMINRIEDQLGKVSPAILLLNLHKKSYDEMLIQFSIKTARDGAWKFATELSDKTGKAYSKCIASRDMKIHFIGKCIANPSKWLSFTLKFIRMFEWRQPSENIELLKLM